jgi:hypothetical protein
MLLSFLAVLACAAPVSASLITWNLSGVTLQDGGTATGSFVFDTVNDDISSYNITVTVGPATVAVFAASYASAAGGELSTYYPYVMATSLTFSSGLPGQSSGSWFGVSVPVTTSGPLTFFLNQVLPVTSQSAGGNGWAPNPLNTALIQAGAYMVLGAEPTAPYGLPDLAVPGVIALNPGGTGGYALGGYTFSVTGWWTLGPPNYNPGTVGVSGGGSTYVVDFTGGKFVSASAVPIPPSAFLLGSGLIPLVWARRKK